jgi:hypothetical protein
VEIQYAAMNMRTEIRGQVNAVQRQRIAYLMQLEASHNGVLSPADRAELVKLQKLAGIAPDAPLSLVNKWAAGLLGATIPNSLQRRSMTNRQRQVETLGMRWPRQPISGRQAVVELLRIRAEWHLSPRQRQLLRMRQSWV